MPRVQRRSLSKRAVNAIRFQRTPSASGLLVGLFAFSQMKGAKRFRRNQSSLHQLAIGLVAVLLRWQNSSSETGSGVMGHMPSDSRHSFQSCHSRRAGKMTLTSYLHSLRMHCWKRSCMGPLARPGVARRRPACGAHAKDSATARVAASRRTC